MPRFPRPPIPTPQPPLPPSDKLRTKLPSADLSNWYWHVAGDLSKAYSSAIGDYVATSDTTFTAWKTAGNLPTKIDSESSLGAVIAGNAAPRPVATGVLAAFQSAKASALDLVQFRILFNHENRIRTLAGQPNITAQQFLTAIASLL